MIDINDLKLKYYSKPQGEEYSDTIARLRPYINKIYGKELFNKSKVARTVTIQVTEDCNLRCSYCYQINKSKKVLSFDKAKKFIDLILSDDISKNTYMNKDNADVIILDFIGGEALLQIDLMDQIVDYFTKRCIELDHPWLYGYMISIGTNGTLYHTERFQQFLTKHFNKISLNVTVDGNKQLHDSCRVFPDGSGSYDLASSAVVDWMKRSKGNNKSTKLTIAPENVMYLKDAIVNMIDLGFEFINENCVYEDVWNIDLAKILYQQLKEIGNYLLDNDLEKKVNLRILDPISYNPIPVSNNNNWCGGDGTMLALDVNGNIFNCVRYMESSLGSDQPPMVIGNVDDGIGVLPEHKKNIESMKCINRRSQSTDKCFWCPIGQGCGWCSAYNYQKFGTPNKRTTTTCFMHTAASLASSYFWNKVLIKDNSSDRLPLMCPEEWAIPIIGKEEYDMIRSLSKSLPIHEDEWYKEHVKPIIVDKEGYARLREPDSLIHITDMLY